jgi:hypothetical protein
MRSYKSFLLLPFIALCSCASTAPEYYYGDKDPSLKEVAIIRSVKEDQSAWLAGFTAVFAANVKTMSRQTGPGTYEMIAPYRYRAMGVPIYVLPGTYVARVECVGGGFIITLDFPPISAEAGHEYQLECSGSSAHNMQPLVTKVPLAGV